MGSILMSMETHTTESGSTTVDMARVCIPTVQLEQR